MHSPKTMNLLAFEGGRDEPKVRLGMTRIRAKAPLWHWQLGKRPWHLIIIWQSGALVLRLTAAWGPVGHGLLDSTVTAFVTRASVTIGGSEVACDSESTAVGPRPNSNGS